jgi:hypothetical protein
MKTLSFNNVNDVIVSARLWLNQVGYNNEEAMTFRNLLLGLAGWEKMDLSLIRHLNPIRREWLSEMILNISILDETTLIIAAGGKSPPKF